MAENGNGEKATRNRSPLYPACNLQVAVERLIEFYRDNGPNQVYVGAAAEGWGYSEKSSTGKRIVAALIHFGLLEESGSGRNRTVKVSSSGMDIALHAEELESQRVQKCIREAAVKPTIYAKLWEEYGARLPARGTVARWLIDEGFNHKVIDDVIADYTATMEYAGLESEDDRIYLGNDTEATTKVPPKPKAEEDLHGFDNGGTRPKKDPMPQITPQSNLEPWDWMIPLMGGKQAILRVPRPLTDEDFSHLESMLTEFFPKQQRMLTSAPTVQKDSEDDNGE